MSQVRTRDLSHFPFTCACQFSSSMSVLWWHLWGQQNNEKLRGILNTFLILRSNIRCMCNFYKIMIQCCSCSKTDETEGFSKQWNGHLAQSCQHQHAGKARVTRMDVLAQRLILNLVQHGLVMHGRTNGRSALFRIELCLDSALNTTARVPELEDL